jgi:hypothetical protein
MGEKMSVFARKGIIQTKPNVGMAEEPATESEELHSFVKLAIAYLGIMAGFSVLGLWFYIAAGLDGPIAIILRNEVVTFYLLLFVLSIAALGRLSRRKRDGAYLTFASLALSLFAPSPSEIIRAPYTMNWWLAIPNTVVGILLLKVLRTLH